MIVFQCFTATIYIIAVKDSQSEQSLVLLQQKQLIHV